MKRGYKNGQISKLGSKCDNNICLSFQGLYKSGDCAEFVFLTCEKLRLGAEAKYLTIEMLDKYVLDFHLFQLTTFTFSTSNLQYIILLYRFY